MHLHSAEGVNLVQVLARGMQAVLTESSSLQSNRSAATKPLHNILRLAAGDFLGKTLNFLAFVYLARVLGVSGFGVLEFAVAVLSYFLLVADGGLELWAIRETARTPDARVLVARVVPLRLALASTAFVVLFVSLPLFPPYPLLRLILPLFGLTLFAQALNLKWVFMGRELMAKVALGLVLGQAVFAVAVISMVHTGEELVWVPILRLCSDAVAALYFAGLFVRTYGWPQRLRIAGARKLLQPALTLGASQAMGLVNYNFDSVLLGFLSGASVVGWYTAAYKPVAVALTVPMTFFTGLFPALARSFVTDRDGEFRSLVARSLQFNLGLAVPMVVGGTMFARPIIGLLYGPDYAQSAAPFQVLIWSAALVAIRTTYVDSLRSTGHQKYDLAAAFTSAALNIALNLLLIPRLGMMGAAFATVTADVVWLAMALHWFRRHVLPRQGWPSFAGPLWGGAAMLAVIYATQPLHWLFRAILSSLAYLGVAAVLTLPQLRPGRRLASARAAQRT